MPLTTVVHRIETFRDMYNISKPLHPDDGAAADPLDVKLVQYLLRCWATGHMPDDSTSSNLREAAKITMREGFISGRYDRQTLRAVQLFETDFCLPGDGIITPLPVQAISSWKDQRSPIEFLRHKLGMLDCNFLYQVNRGSTGQSFDEIRRTIVRGMPADLAAALYPELKTRRHHRNTPSPSNNDTVTMGA